MTIATMWRRLRRRCSGKRAEDEKQIRAWAESVATEVRMSLREQQDKDEALRKRESIRERINRRRVR